MSCHNLFVLEIYDDSFLNTWVPLQTCLPGRETNCGPNTYVFLNLMDRISGQMASEISESTALINTAQLSKTKRKNENNQSKGTDFNFISNKLNEDNNNNKYMIRQINQTINSDYNQLLSFFNKTLEKNQITILNIKGSSIGHIVTIAKRNDGVLVLLDPQQSERHDGNEAIIGYLTNWGGDKGIIAFSYYCINNELKKAISETQLRIRKEKDNDEPPRKKQKISHNYYYKFKELEQKIRNDIKLQNSFNPSFDPVFHIGRSSRSSRSSKFKQKGNTVRGRHGGKITRKYKKYKKSRKSGKSRKIKKSRKFKKSKK